LLAGCSTDFGYAPVARIALNPRFVAQGDGFHTDVMIDGRMSADPLVRPDAGASDLTFAWSFAGDTVQIVQGQANGNLTNAGQLVVHVAGQRTVSVTLTVTNPSGESATATTILGLTVPAPDAG
jgi:hypothetical protein